MILTLLYARRSSYTPGAEYRRDTGKLLKGSHLHDPTNLPSVVDTLRKSAFKVSHNFHPDQIAQMDPVLRHHLRLESPGTPSEPPE